MDGGESIKINNRHSSNLIQPGNSKESGLFPNDQIKENEAKYQLVFQYAPIGLIYFDPQGIITSCNDAFVNITGSSYEAVIGLEIGKLPDKRVVKLFNDAMKGQFGVLEGICNLIPGQKPICGKLNVQPIMGIDGQILGGVGILEDITERSEYELRLQYLSQRDPVTELFNRSYFERYLESINNSLFKEQVAIVICDIDDLKLINDTMGHLAGDRLLRTAGKILEDSAPDNAVVARIGGDEFAILIPACASDTIDSFTQNLRKKIESHNLANADMPVSLSLGYAVSQENQTDLKVLMREADLCMYRQKIQHRQKNRRSILQSCFKSWYPDSYLREEKTRRLKEYLSVFCRALDVSEVTFQYILGLADYHDIGKVGIENNSSSMQNSDIELSALEIQKHCEIGYRIALASDDLAVLANAILKHHEFWNGQGYPLGIKGEEIPLECRIFSIVNAYEKMISGEPDPPALTREQAAEALQAMAGQQLDPKLTAIFIRVLQEQIGTW